MFCGECGILNPDDKKFCAGCGAALTAPAPRAPGGAATPVDAPTIGPSAGLVPGTLLARRYRIVQPLGAGGMGAVYLAQDTQLRDVPVAVKLVRDVVSGDARALEQLLTETLIARRLHHPHIVGTHTLEQAPPFTFLVMEYVEGETLAGRLRRDGPLREAEVRRIGMALCEALAYAHAQGVLHRDVKPANVLLGTDGSVKLADFGIARVAVDALTRASAVVPVGTAPYMAPELLGRQRASPASDLYALGVLLYELLTGTVPFPDEAGLPAQLYAIVHTAPLVPAKGWPKDLGDTVLRLLAKAPGNRVGTASEVRAELVEGTVQPAEPFVQVDMEFAAMRDPESPATSAVAARSPQRPALQVDANTSLTFARVPPGTFLIGSATGGDDEKPEHKVVLTRGFDLGTTPVTQRQWQALMGNNPSFFTECGVDCPVDSVSWEDVQLFIDALNSRNDGYVYRLPTEAEWEYASRAGVTGDDLGSLDALAWYDKNAGGCTHPVGTRQPNAWGLHDMHGNVWEWVTDRYGEYSSLAVADPTGPTSGGQRVLRGGSALSSARNCRSADRNWSDPRDRDYNFGFRLLRGRVRPDAAPDVETGRRQSASAVSPADPERA